MMKCPQTRATTATATQEGYHLIQGDANFRDICCRDMDKRCLINQLLRKVIYYYKPTVGFVVYRMCKMLFNFNETVKVESKSVHKSVIQLKHQTQFRLKACWSITILKPNSN